MKLELKFYLKFWKRFAVINSHVRRKFKYLQRHKRCLILKKKSSFVQMNRWWRKSLNHFAYFLKHTLQIIFCRTWRLLSEIWWKKLIITALLSLTPIENKTTKWHKLNIKLTPIDTMTNTNFWNKKSSKFCRIQKSMWNDHDNMCLLA